MANSTSTQVILDGARNAVVKFEGVLDTSDLAYTVFLDPATLVGIDNTGSRKATGFRINRISFSVRNPGMNVNLFWDAPTPQRIEALASDDNVLYDGFGGLTNNATSPTGKLGISTNGWSGISSFYVVLELTKTGA